MNEPMPCRQGEPDWGRGGQYAYVIAHKLDDGWRGPCKLGVSNQPRARLSSLQGGNPSPIGLYGVVAVPGREHVKHIETYLHHALKDRRLMGEWFAIEPEHALELASFTLLTAVHADSPDRGDRALEIAMGLTWRIGAPQAAEVRP